MLTVGTVLGAIAVLLGAPEITGPINDLAGVISEADEAALDAAIRAHRGRSGVRLGVLVAESTGGAPADDWCSGAARGWAGHDGGVLLCVAVLEPSARLEVGRRLRAYVPKSRAAEILAAVAPKIRAEDYGGAIREVVDEVIASTKGLTVGRPSGVPFGNRLPWHFIVVAMLGYLAAVVAFARFPDKPAKVDAVLTWLVGPLIVGLVFGLAGGDWLGYPLTWLAGTFGAAFTFGAWTEYRLWMRIYMPITWLVVLALSGWISAGDKDSSVVSRAFGLAALAFVGSSLLGVPVLYASENAANRRR